MEAAYRGVSSCITSVLVCFFLSVFFVLSLYIWGTRESRDHPDVIIRRFYSVFAMMCLSPPVVYVFMDKSILQKTSLLHLLGLRFDGLIQALFYPLVLTMILFLGSLLMQGLTGLWRLYAEPMYWFWNLSDLAFLRSHVVAPIAEEFVFRGCMMPLLLQCFPISRAIFIAPLFFGVAHLHHMVDRVRHERIPFLNAFIISIFQMSYTTVFGAYSAFLFVRTGHLAAPCIAHAFCNHIGFPDFSEVLSYKKSQRYLVSFLFVLGLLAWIWLLKPLTSPELYHNHSVFWIDDAWMKM
ncbi:CAAX prenyl protease 2 [Frankliniella fusca]|uniref:CAAX prenyl protease 2 n=1 Tax=Frankliniella fusca TaxID=407009 RepID=A0AAE1HQU7_9NEOP|nr:CAAX prenyl protease 2 [Frankliniella fusca]